MRDSDPEEPALLEDSEPALDSFPVLLLLDVLSALLSTVMPPKLAVLVMAGLRLRLELSESVLLQARWWSDHLSSFSELLCLLPEVLPEPSRLPRKSCLFL